MDSSIPYRKGAADILGHQIVYDDWGRAEAPVLLCWHGMARTGHVFRTFAQHMARTHRVICPDLIGRGMSSWSAAPTEEYCMRFYADLAAGFVDALGHAQVDWLGISLGGAIGIRAAASTLKGRIGKLVLVDTGPTLRADVVQAIGDYVRKAPSRGYPTLDGFIAAQSALYESGGDLGDDDWRWMAAGSVRRRDDGSFAESYDPAIAAQIEQRPEDFEQWEWYDAVEAETLVLRGAISTLLSHDTVAAMAVRGPKAAYVELPGVGHAPQLIRDNEIRLVSDFLGDGR